MTSSTKEIELHKTVKSNRILIADDDSVTRRIIRSIIEQTGFIAVEAKNGREAYQILNENPRFAACIIDIQMPIIQGTELVRKMRSDKHLSQIPVMVITAQDAIRGPGESMEAGAIVFVPKPFTTSQMMAMLRLLVASPQ